MTIFYSFFLNKSGSTQGQHLAPGDFGEFPDLAPVPQYPRLSDTHLAIRSLNTHGVVV